MKQHEFGYRIRQALNEGLENLDYKTTYRLEQARKLALKHQRKPQKASQVAVTPVLQGAGTASLAGGDPSGALSWLQRAGLLLPLAVLLAGFILIYEWRHDSVINDLADIDFAVLLDQAPLETYADPGFSAVLQSRSVE